MQTYLSSYDGGLGYVPRLALLPAPATDNPVGRTSPLKPSGSLMPPTGKDWDTHREVITRLYVDEDRTLKDVQAIMESQYYFKATKRMYNRRIKLWNINKNYKEQEKELLAAQIVQAYSERREVADISLRARPVKLNRIYRHCRSRKSKAPARDDTEPIQRTARSKIVASHPSGEVQSSNVTMSTSPITQPVLPEVESYATPLSDEAEPPTLNPSSGISSQLSTRRHSDVPPEYSQMSSSSPQATSMAQLNIKLYTPESSSLSPTPPLSPPANVTDTEIILFQTLYYCNWQFTGCPPPYSSSLIHVPEVVTDTANSNFWYKAKSAIYFLKMHAPELAWSVLNQACAMLPDLLRFQPITFLKDIYATISPVNTRVYPEVRVHLLQFVAMMSRIRFGDAHPLSIICHHLQMDKGCRNVSETALRLLSTIFEERLGPGHSEILQIRRRLVVLMRRDGDLTAAETSATNLVRKTELSMGLYHEQTRVAMGELVHVYIDQGEYEKAAVTCSQVLQRGRKDLGSGFPDGRCVHAMEDMALACELRHDLAQSAAWLDRALRGALEVWGPESSTIHIWNKLVSILRKDGKDEESTNVHRRYLWMRQWSKVG